MKEIPFLTVLVRLGFNFKRDGSITGEMVYRELHEIPLAGDDPARRSIVRPKCHRAKRNRTHLERPARSKPPSPSSRGHALVRLALRERSGNTKSPAHFRRRQVTAQSGRHIADRQQKRGGTGFSIGIGGWEWPFSTRFWHDTTRFVTT